MGSIVGNKRRHNEHTFDVKYAALMEIEFPKKHPVHVEKEQEKNNRYIQE